MAAGKLVKTGTVEVSYSIFEYEGEDGIVYDAVLVSGESSDEWFESIEEAENWVEDTVGA